MTITSIFAHNGDISDIPETNAEGKLSLSTGFGPAFDRNLISDPSAQPIVRTDMNKLFNFIFSEIQKLQSGEFEQFSTELSNAIGGYDRGAVVRAKNFGGFWISTVGSNTTDPDAGGAGWVRFSNLNFAIANGTADAILASTPLGVGSLVSGLRVRVRASAANTVAGPTINLDNLGSRAIKRNGGGTLIAGDIAGAGHWMDLTYDETLTCWILANPAGVSTSTMVISGSEINEMATNGQASVVVNNKSYQGGNTQFRDFDVYDGKGNIVAKFRGSDKTLVMSGRVSAQSASFSGDVGLSGINFNSGTKLWGNSAGISVVIDGSGTLGSLSASTVNAGNANFSRSGGDAISAGGDSGNNFIFVRSGEIRLRTWAGGSAGLITNSDFHIQTEGQNIVDGETLFSISATTKAATFAGEITAPAATINGIATAQEFRTSTTAAKQPTYRLATSPADPNFVTWVTNGQAEGGVGTVVSSIESVYSGQGTSAAIDFVRGGDTTNGWVKIRGVGGLKVDGPITAPAATINSLTVTGGVDGQGTIIGRDGASGGASISSAIGDIVLSPFTGGVVKLTSGITAPAATINGRDVFNGLSQVGEIKISPINAALPGTFVCDGSAVSRAQYPKLYAFIGDTFHTSADGDHFNLPDYRAMFLRGLDSGRGKDTGRTISADPQADAFGSHTHNYFSSTMGITNSGTPHRGIWDDSSQNTTPHPTSVAGDTETRPVNMAVVYCIVHD